MGMFIFDVLEVDERANWGNAFYVPHKNLKGNTNGNLANAIKTRVAALINAVKLPALAPAFA